MGNSDRPQFLTITEWEQFRDTYIRPMAQAIRERLARDGDPLLKERPLRGYVAEPGPDAHPTHVSAWTYQRDEQILRLMGNLRQAAVCHKAHCEIENCGVSIYEMYKAAEYLSVFLLGGELVNPGKEILKDWPF